ncbi:MAG: hypothetical protein DMF50_00585, partial [Acidobacteria bacterium]
METQPAFACYRITKHLAEGYCSKVYLADHTITGEARALKVFESNEPAAVDFFANELAVLAETSHPNLIALLDHGRTTDSGANFLAFEYVSGTDFVSASRDVSQHQFYAMLAQVCRGLDYLHCRGLIHGDLKPQNLLVSAQGASKREAPLVKLVDVGFSTSLRKPSDGKLRGSATYLAPETILGERPTTSSDLYSFGAVLYECLAGRPPFMGDDVGAVLQQQLQDQPQPIEGEVLKELHPIVYRLLSKIPTRRAASAAELLQQLNSASPAGQFRLHTADTWASITRSGPMVGRQGLLHVPLETLRSLRGGTSRQRAPCLLIIGPPGVGKSRMV